MAIPQSPGMDDPDTEYGDRKEIEEGAAAAPVAQQQQTRPPTVLRMRDPLGRDRPSSLRSQSSYLGGKSNRPDEDGLTGLGTILDKYPEPQEDWEAALEHMAGIGFKVALDMLTEARNKNE